MPNKHILITIFFSLFSVVQLVMWVNFVNIWIHAILARDQDVKMVEFVKLTTQLQCLDSDAGVQLDSQLHCVKSQNEMHAIQDHVKTVDLVIWNHCRIMFAHAPKDIQVS